MVVVRASQAGNETYAAASPVDRSFEVKAEIIPSFAKALSLTPQADNSVKLRFLAPPNLTFSIERSTDLIQWSEIHSLSSGLTGQFEYVDSTAALLPSAYYRAIGR
jgi:hypothetical protein